ncbi:MAG: hypothetical protein COB17_10415 [Sulfurimonas sp.]|nr:MAG: hypothetical protein COB17_10415 [Sulfurimonas sp.]
MAEGLSISYEEQKIQEKISCILKRSKNIVEQINLGIIVIKKNEIIMANKSFLDIFGFESFNNLI